MSKFMNIGKCYGLVLLAMAVIVGVAALPSVASADFGIKPESFASSILDSDGAVVPSPQAGAHPFAQQVKFAFNTKPPIFPASPGGSYPGSGPDPDPDGDAKTIITNLPAGFIGNPQAVPLCAQSDFPPLGFGGYSRCSTSAQVGLATPDLGVSSGLPFPTGLYKVPVYNLVPPKGVVARLGFVFLIPIVIDITVRTGGDYGITATVKNASEMVNIYGVTVTLWGVPADSRHDTQRFRPGGFYPGDTTANCGQPVCPLSSGLPLTPFLTNPSQCDVPVTTGLQVESWQNPGTFLSYTSTPILHHGCDRLALKPTLVVTPTSAGAGEPTGIAVDLGVEQLQAANAPGTPPIKKVSVTLPEGVTVSPSSADGLEACSSEQIGLGNDVAPTCPDSSKVGSVQIDTPVLDEPLMGSVYLAKPKNNPFGSLVALYVVAKGNGVLVKLPGVVSLDPVTGRIVSTFDNTPQLPFSRLHVAFKGGPRAPLSQANTCGAKTTSATLTSWAGQVVDIAGSYSVGAGAGAPTCGPQGFAPQMTAGSLSSAAGASSPFSFRLTRTDADQQLSSVQTVLPPGLLASVKDVTLCPEAQAAAGTCGVESLIGRATVGSGPGPSPFYIDAGRAYLTTGYKGAPFGLSIVVPAVAGPFDLGDVVVRAALTIDPVTTRVTVSTDPFPAILQGIPLQVRDVRLNVDRPGFMLNPTSCTAQSIDATVTSTGGARSSLANAYQATDCPSLAFKPKLAIALTGKGQVKDGAHPGLTAHLSQSAGEAHIAQTEVTLPLSMALDPDNAQGLCKPEQAAAKACTSTTIVGQATAVSVLHEPLRGPVYFVEGIRVDPKSGRKIKTLPKLFIPLKGEGVEVDLNASSQVDKLDRLVTTFANVPDAPISSFDLSITGGKHGILVVSDTNLCQAKQVAEVRMDGQNGKNADSTLTVATPCGPQVLSAKVGAKSVSIKLGGLGAGKVTVSGTRLKTASRTLAKSPVATVTPGRAGGRVPAKIRVTFDPAGPTKAKSYMLNLEPAKATKSTRR
jgi:hypothetical protein